MIEEIIEGKKIAMYNFRKNVYLIITISVIILSIMRV